MLGHVAESLKAADLDTAHYITMGFWLGFERGHRWRLVLGEMISTESARKAIEMAARRGLPQGPYQVGFDLGYAFECMRANDE